MRLAILGGPGAGKSTQSQRLSKHFNLPVISTGDTLREAISAHTTLGLKAQPYVKKGELLPDEMMIEMIRERLLESDVKNGWILEGYPRTAFQAEELDFLLEELGQKLQRAIYLQISEALMKERSLRRSLLDDTPESIQRRIARFQEYTIPLLEYFQGTHRLLIIAAESPPNAVEKAILNKLTVF